MFSINSLICNKQFNASRPIIASMGNSGKPVEGHRQIRSYVLRTGRLTVGQQRALTNLWPTYGITNNDKLLDLGAVFGNENPVTLEIGFGNGDSLVAMAARAPERNFIGAEVHEPGVGHCLMRINELDLQNVRVVRQDAVEFLTRRLADRSIARVNLFFPDPWHKKRHHKRRIVQREFADLLARKLQPGGIFHVATDWPDYAEHIAATMANSQQYIALQMTPTDRVTSKFDIRGQRLGHSNWEQAWCSRNKLPS
jgi:tRNA (guanine-N7-)-methyltransferase